MTTSWLTKVVECVEASDEPQILLELFNIFLETTPVRLQKLDIAITTGDLKAARLIAHTLKSSCAYVGAQHMRLLCEELERSSQKPQAGGLKALADKINGEYEVVKVTLERTAADLIGH